MIAQTLTPTELPRTGVPWLDSLFAYAYVALAALSAASVVLAVFQVKLDAVKAQAAKLLRSVKAIATGVEQSKEEILVVLADEFPSVPRAQLERIAGRLHDGVTGRVEIVSSRAGTEPTVAPIVTEVQAHLDAGRDPLNIVPPK